MVQYNPDIHQCRSIRLKEYDYSSAGMYFVTVCIQDRQCLFGDAAEGEMKLNDAGRMVLSVWNELPRYGQGVAVDEFIVMPNHIHGIIVLNVGAGPRACPDHEISATTKQTNKGQKKGRPQGGAPTISMTDLVHRFKSLTTAVGQLWRRNYYGRIIRSEDELARVRQYIHDNPSNWETDEENPNRPGGDS